MKIRVGILGATGYPGQELLKILQDHPHVSVEYLGSLRQKTPGRLKELLPLLPESVGRLRVQPFRAEEASERCDILFSALPHGSAMKLAPAFLRNPKPKLIDLSGDFRLKSTKTYSEAYGAKHTSLGWLRQAVYGLTEWNRPHLTESRLIANPGCYPTAALLALGPLAERRMLEDSPVIVDAKSGITGAGRSLKEEILFSEINEDFRAYKVDAHPHIPEMEQTLHQWSHHPVPVTFVPHLVPLNRGLYATIYVRLKQGTTRDKVRSAYEERYADEPFVRLLPDGIWPQVKAVAGTNDCHLNVRMKDRARTAILLCAIDNLGKGAAGQAVQNMNLTFGLPETSGLTSE